MAKPKAEAWLREAFRDGVDEFTRTEARGINRPYPAAHLYCWLARFDPARRPCSGELERFHYVRRQDVEAAMWQQLLGARFAWLSTLGWRELALSPGERDELILLAAWDARNGGHACEEHHRRYDGHQASLPRDRLVVPYSALPSRVVQFGFDYSEGRLLDRFPASI